MRVEATRWLLLVVAALTFSACSGFQARWEATRKAVPRSPYSGVWEGRWTSSQHPGHGDRLQCILTPAPGPGERYHAEFKARWLKIMTSEHSVALHLSPGKPAGPRSFTGSAKLKTIVGSGTYRCTGTITPTRMRATYDATYDAGTFELERAK